jgi:hypothetical protein
LRENTETWRSWTRSASVVRIIPPTDPEADEQRPPAAESIGEHPDDRARHNPHRSVGGENDADEWERETEAHAHDGQNGKGNPTGNPSEERPRRQRQRQRCR